MPVTSTNDALLLLLPVPTIPRSRKIRCTYYILRVILIVKRVAVVSIRMHRMIKLSTPALFALFAVSLTYTIFKDQRYPSYILTAKNTTCTANGSFRHPSNCSWFYKCESKTVKGHYQKQFFECAPGTVFDDTLDICISKSAADEACGPGPIPESLGCKKLSPLLEGYCYNNENCSGTKTTSGMCHYKVLCDNILNGTVHCDKNDFVRAGVRCEISSNVVCQYLGKASRL